MHTKHTHTNECCALFKHSVSVYGASRVSDECPRDLQQSCNRAATELQQSCNRAAESDECPRDLEEGRLGQADRDLPSNSDAGVGLEGQHRVQQVA